MNQNNCPGCGAVWNGKRCRSCGYEPFHEDPRRKNAPVSKGKKARKQYPLTGFLVLLVLIGGMMPVLRNWGLKLEATEEINRPTAPEPVIPATDLLCLYRDKTLQIFTEKEDAEHLSDGLTLYVQNEAEEDLLLFIDSLRVNGSDSRQQLYCKAAGQAVTRNRLRFDPETEPSEVHAVTFRLAVYDGQNNLLMTTETITLGEPKAAEKPDS